MKITVPLTFLAYLSILAWFGHLTSFSQESVPWRRSEGVREPHKDRRCKYSCAAGRRLARSEPLLLARLCAKSQLAPKGFLRLWVS